MSRITSRAPNKLSTSITTDEMNVESEIEETKLNFTEQRKQEEHIARVVFEANASASQLSRGHTIRLTGAKDIFSIENMDSKKGIITSITAKAVYSDASEPITVSLNLFNTTDAEPNVNNEQGWLHAPQHTDLGATSSVGLKGFKNVLNILPYEKTRSELVVYKPDEFANSNHIQRYGSYNADSLYDDVVSFPGEAYYLVQQGHIVLSVIRQNWEQLGINVDDEHRFNGKYIQVPANVFDRVVKDLEAQVLSRMPFTDLSDIRAQFTSKQASNFTIPHEDGEDGKYKLVVELQFQYQFPPTKQEVVDEQ